MSKKQKFEESRINQTSRIFKSLCKFCDHKPLVNVVIRDRKHKTSLLFTVLVMIIFEPSSLSTRSWWLSGHSLTNDRAWVSKCKILQSRLPQFHAFLGFSLLDSHTIFMMLIGINLLVVDYTIVHRRVVWNHRWSSHCDHKPMVWQWCLNSLQNSL